MADVTISELNNLSPSGSLILPVSDGNTTGKASVDGVIDTIGSRTSSLILPNGTTAQRPIASSGAIRFNTATSKLELFDGARWGNITLDYGAYNLEILVVAGGGWGGIRGGGGGGGVLNWFNVIAQSSISYDIAVGQGATSNSMNNGGNSSIFAQYKTYEAIGGGRGGDNSGATAGPSVGGSGGGGGDISTTGANGIAGQGNKGGNGVNPSPHYGGAGGGFASAGGNGGTGTVGGTGLALDQFIKQVPPFNNLNGEVVTHVSSGGGWNSAFAGRGAGGPGAGGGGSGQTNNAKWYGCGGHFNGSGYQGVVVVRYLGTQRGVGGNFITYNANDNKTYHVFTTIGNSQFYTN